MVPATIDSVKPLAATAPVAAVYATLDEVPVPPGVHVVRQGETLFAISQRYGVTIDQIKAFNEMKNNQLRIGQSLMLNGIDAGIAASSNAPTLVRVSAPARVVTQKPATYTVRPGDTLYAIALKFAVQLDDLLRWNKLHAKSVLQPGDRIRLTV